MTPSYPDGFLASRHAGLSVVEDFVPKAAKVEAVGDLKALVADACDELGFDYFALVHHIRFGIPTDDHVRLTNYPAEWIAVIRDRHNMRSWDPALRAAERASAGFRWNRLESLISLTDQDRSLLKEAASYGIGDGFTVPNHVPGETFGSCHFVVRPGVEFPEHNIPAAQSIGSFAFEAARHLMVTSIQPSETYMDPVPLTDRQWECLIFAARGKSDSVIAQLLDIRPRTVNEHIEAAKRRYCVATRSQLMVRALFRSEILYSEVLA